MVFFVAFRAMSIGRKALEIDHRFSGFLACSIGIWFSFQALVNVGAAAGMLPTKGLTLPLISYGGHQAHAALDALVGVHHGLAGPPFTGLDNVQALRSDGDDVITDKFHGR